MNYELCPEGHYESKAWNFIVTQGFSKTRQSCWEGALTRSFIMKNMTMMKTEGKKRKVTLCAIQLPNYREGKTPEEKKESNIRAAFTMMVEAAKAGADIICLGEIFPLVGVEYNKDTLVKLAEKEGGPLFRKLSDFAGKYRVNLITPAYVFYGKTIHNTAWVFSRTGKLAGRYFKVHCTKGERDNGAVQGDKWPVFKLDFGTIGVMICHDNSFPESAKCLALNGAEVIFWPHVQGGWGDVIWDITLRSRAIDNGVFLVSACYGKHPDESWKPGMMQGRTGVVGPDGMILAEAGREAGIVMATVDLNQKLYKAYFTTNSEKDDFRKEMLDDRRPETYRAITKVKKVKGVKS